MIAGLLLIAGAVLLVWGFYRWILKADASPRIRFWVPGNAFNQGDFWSIAPIVGVLVVLGFVLFTGGLPGLGGGAAPAASSPAPASAADPQPKYPYREPDGRGGVTVHLSPDDWYWIDTDGQVTRSKGKGCRFHPGAHC